MASFATQVQIRRGTEAENDAFTGAEGEVTMDLTNKQLRVHDGQTMGGMKIPNSETVFGTSQIQDGAITEPKLSTDLQTKINEKTSGAGRNIGDIFWTTRTDSALNGAVEANGAQYNFADVNGGDNNVQALLESGALPSVSIAKFDAMVAKQGGCDSFGYDSGATYFKVPKKVGRVLVRCQKPGAVNYWFNLYSDGWVEQGGVVPADAGSTAVVINLSLSMANADYMVIGQVVENYTGTDSSGINFYDRATRSVKLNKNNTSRSVSWQVSGYAAAFEYTPDKWDYQNVQVERPMVQLFNGATDEAVAQCTEVLSDVAGLKLNKADTDLSNVSSNIDYVVESQEPTEANGYTWYRLYKSGWVEQGGQFVHPKQGTNTEISTTVSLPVIMSNTNYYVSPLTFITDGGNTTHIRNNKNDRTTTTLIIYTYSTTSIIRSYTVNWQVSGMSAQ